MRIRQPLANVLSATSYRLPEHRPRAGLQARGLNLGTAPIKKIWWLAFSCALLTQRRMSQTKHPAIYWQVACGAPWGPQRLAAPIKRVANRAAHRIRR